MVYEIVSQLYYTPYITKSQLPIVKNIKIEVRKLIVLNNVKLRTLREEKDISQEDLAERIGTTKNMIIQYECGIKQPSVAMLKRIADVLCCSMDDLVCNVGVNQNDPGRSPEAEPQVTCEQVRQGSIA